MGFFFIQLKLVVLEFELQGKSKGGEGNCEPQKSQKRTELASGEGRIESLGATVNVQNPLRSPQTAVEEAPADFRLTCLGAPQRRKVKSLGSALSPLQAPVAHHRLLLLSNNFLLLYSHLP